MMKEGFLLTIEKGEFRAKFQNQHTWQDDIHFSTPDVEFLLQGVLLNKKQLLESHALSDFKTLILELYAKRKSNILAEFEGEFRGFIYDKKEKKVFAFTNPTATQRVFYFKNQEKILVASNLNHLHSALNKEGILPQPNLNAIDQLLCFGNLLDGATPILHVSKILDGHFLNINLEDLHASEKQYFGIENVVAFSPSKEGALKDIHEIFRNSVFLEYKKDDDFGANHLSLLSGGLDSRVALFYALQISEIPDRVLCFSQTGYFDETISRKIAKNFNLPYEFIPLDGGQFLEKIDQLTAISEGCGIFTGGIHVQHAIEQMVYENFGLFHSGQIGDGILGGFNTAPVRKKPNQYKIVQNEMFYPKVEETLKNSFKNFDTEEHFLLRNVGYNRTVLGAQVFQQKRYQVSPFMTKDFLKMALSLPESWKFKHRFYMEWISKYCKDATLYRWERTLLKPNKIWKVEFGDRYLKPAFIKANEWLKTSQNASMYPYQFYFDQSEVLQKFYQDYFNDNLYRLDAFPELKTNVETLFSQPKFYHKAQALNILSIFKLYF